MSSYSKIQPDCPGNMVPTYIEDPDWRRQTTCSARSFCLCCCFGGGIESSGEEEEGVVYNANLTKVNNLLQSANISERNLESKVKDIMEESNPCLQTIVDELVKLGYDAAISKSNWEYSKKTLSTAGNYEYIEVKIGEEKVLIDINFKSKFEIGRPTRTYIEIFEALPFIFVGQKDILKKIVAIVSKAAKASLKKQGLLVPRWRKAKYFLTRWGSCCIRGNGA